MVLAKAAMAMIVNNTSYEFLDGGLPQVRCAAATAAMAAGL
jgi:hypothetical protein